MKTVGPLNYRKIRLFYRKNWDILWTILVVILFLIVAVIIAGLISFGLFRVGKKKSEALIAGTRNVELE